MPCNSDYLNPSQKEVALRRAATLLVHVYQFLGEPVSPALKAAAANLYCSDDYVPALCARLKKLKRFSKDRFEELVYNAKSPVSRDLAGWWEEHENADKARVAKEAAQKKQEELRQQALNKLSPAERKALGVK